jgi:hypothetical protein
MLAGLDVSWTQDPSVQYSTLELFQSTASGYLDWSVTQPSSLTDFAPFVLPADTAAKKFETGAMFVNFWTHHSDHFTAYADLWSAPGYLQPDPTTDTVRWTLSSGKLLLQ